MPTRSPAAKPAASATTVPTTSCPGTTDGRCTGRSPSATCRSVRHTAQALTRTSSSPSPGEGAGSPGADRLPAVPPVRPRAIRGAWNLQVGEHALARAEGVLPVDPVAVSEVNHSPRDRGQRGRLGWRPVIVDLPFPGDGGVGPYGPARWRRFPVVLRVGQALQPPAQPVTGVPPLPPEHLGCADHPFELLPHRLPAQAGRPHRRVPGSRSTLPRFNGARAG